ncbi:MAG TPA: hypothetical protein VNB23_14890 [Ramlibacter sp.]|nr:hypothetical protein [Ramlibacter sp.]
MSALRRAALVFGCLAAGSSVAQASEYRNVTTGAAMRPGVYGRIVLKGEAAPPPLIYPQPVVADAGVAPPDARPVYLYVPPGQVRKWKQNCARWQACSEPVLFVRVDDSPSRWGKWRHLREQVALQDRD